MHTHKRTHNKHTHTPKYINTRFTYPKWEVVLGARDRINIPFLMHDCRLCQLDVEMTNN